MDPASVERDGGIALEQTRLVEACKPLLDGRDAPAVVQRLGDRGEDACHPVEVAGGASVLDRGLEISVGLVPSRRAPVEEGDELRLALGELTPEDVAEEPVVAIPDTLAVERDEEEIRALDLLELAARAAVVEHGVAEPAAHLLEDGGPAEEPQRARTEPRQVFGVDVGGQIRVAAVQPERLAVATRSPAAVAERQGGEVHGGRPAFGVADEARHVGEGKLEAERAEEDLAFPRRQ